MMVKIDRPMAARLAKTFGYITDVPKEGEEVLLYPYGSKIIKAKRSYYVVGYGPDGEDIKEPLKEVWFKKKK